MSSNLPRSSQNAARELTAKLTATPVRILDAMHGRRLRVAVERLSMPCIFDVLDEAKPVNGWPGTAWANFDTEGTG
jgi:hypothetical protein